MDLIAQGQIIENFIESSFELVDTWNGYWNAVMPIGHRPTMAHPFPRLQSDGFWDRIPNPGYDANTDYNISSMTKLREIYSGARLDGALFMCVMDPVAQERLRAVLVHTYFAPEIQLRVSEQGFVNLAAFAYAKDVIAGVKDGMESFAASACGPRKGTPSWRPPTSCPGARATTTFPPTVCACAGCATGPSTKG